MIINNKNTEAEEFAYDGCHKIYLIEDEKDKQEALETGYELYPVSVLKEKFNTSCPLKFISNWKLNTRFVEQFEEAVFE